MSARVLIRKNVLFLYTVIFLYTVKVIQRANRAPEYKIHIRDNIETYMYIHVTIQIYFEYICLQKTN